ncbi:PREDICTED: neuropilin-2-like [Priapulus caudatus]|uniref:Neuropilin-2-like n=1 Tax=Priapulus caudatus TaxID=37621 RepID=A0ABM1F2U3_PRICU|nr:PREDICTED: neuropilin-2-like [Priapulus caudatus]
MSPTYPGSYPINLNCTFRFMGQPGERVKIHFRDFDVYSGGSHCPYDWMKVYDGAAPRLVDGHVVNLIGGAPICGEKHQVELFSSRESLVAVFETSWSPRHENRGFDGQFQFSRNFVKLGSSVLPLAGFVDVAVCCHLLVY